MKLKRIYFDRITYGTNEGKMAGEVTFDSPNGEIKLTLKEESQYKIFAVLAEELTEQTRECATVLMQNILDATAQEKSLLENPL